MLHRFIIWGLFILLNSAIHGASHQPQKFLKTIQGTPNEGEQIYNHFCSTCHAAKPLISLGAPQIGNEQDWTARLKKGFAVLFHNTEEGINAMPPRGGCFECTDEQLHLAIEFMLPKANKKYQ